MINRILLLGNIALAACWLSGCSNQTKPAPKVESGDPVRQLNPTKWVASAEDLATPVYFGDANGH